MYWVSQKLSERVQTEFLMKKNQRGIRNKKLGNVRYGRPLFYLVRGKKQQRGAYSAPSMHLRLNIDEYIEAIR